VSGVTKGVGDTVTGVTGGLQVSRANQSELVREVICLPPTSAQDGVGQLGKGNVVGGLTSTVGGVGKGLGGLGSGTFAFHRRLTRKP